MVMMKLVEVILCLTHDLAASSRLSFLESRRVMRLAMVVLLLHLFLKCMLEPTLVEDGLFPLLDYSRGDDVGLGQRVLHGFLLEH